MDEGLERQLMDRYPEIFSDRYGRVHETAMSWGFTCGNGWFALIDALCAEIEQHVKRTAGSAVVALQVKEKFGTLRFRVRSSDELVHGLIRMAEALSARVCEACGALDAEPGSQRTPECTVCPHPEPDEQSPLSVRTAIGAANTAGVASDDNRGEHLFRLPRIRTAEWRPLASALEELIDFEIRHAGLPPVYIDAVIETETLAFRWRGGDGEGRVEGFFRMVEAYSARCAVRRQR